MMYCLDTNVIIAISRGETEIKEKIKELQKQDAFLSITPITAGELFKVAYAAERKTEAINFVYTVVNMFEMLEFSVESCRILGEKHAELKRLGKQTQESDLMIASIAIANGACLITQNKKHFENIKGLKILAL